LDDAVTDPVKRQLVIDRVFSSSKAESDTGFAAAIRNQIKNFPVANIILSDQSALCDPPQQFCYKRATITIPALSGYQIPVGQSEVITAAPVPMQATDWAQDTGVLRGVYQMTIYARTASFSGTFFAGVSLLPMLQSSAPRPL
jgi:hypothetical protein